MKYIVFLIILCTYLFRGWFMPGTLSSGDWGYRFAETSQNVTPESVTWSTYFGNGLGGGRMILAPLDTWYIFTSQITERLSIPWEVSERIMWFIPLVLLAVIAGVMLSRIVTRSAWSYISVIYLLNSYFLTILSGGQMGVLWAIALAPLSLMTSIHLIDAVLGKKRVIVHEVCNAALVVALQLAFDARILYVTLVAIGMYAVFVSLYSKASLTVMSRLLISAAISGLIVFVLNAFWVAPLILYPSPISSSLGPEYLSSDALRFFSFADFSHALSWLHPNWPENIFGKTSFLRPEFLLFPICAYGALLFVHREKGTKKIYVLYFALVGLIGSLLAKGINPPFGNIYEWMFVHVPGFIMFRDPTKFYVLIALSYTVLIPYTLEQVHRVITDFVKKRNVSLRVGPLVFCLFFLLWVGINRDIFIPGLRGTFAPVHVPDEYVQLKDYLVRDESFFRVLWVPDRSRYGYFDDDRLAMNLGTLSVASPSSFIPWIKDAANDLQLRRYAVKYIVVPTDIKGELFVTDRVYDNALRQFVINSLDNVNRFPSVKAAGNIAVYTVPETYGHAFFVDQPDVSVAVRRIHVTQYDVTIPIQDMDTRLVFSETYSPYWRLSLRGVDIHPTKTVDNLQEYRIPKGMSGIATLEYIPQRLVMPMLWIAVVLLFGIGVVLQRYR